MSGEISSDGSLVTEEEREQRDYLVALSQSMDGDFDPSMESKTKGKGRGRGRGRR